MAERRISGQGQIKIYLGKCFRLFRNEKQWKNFISALIIILIISLVTGKEMFSEYEATNKGAFAIVSACIWAGLFNSIQSICRERAIIKREYRTGLRISSYIMAHVIYEMFLCAVEAAIMLLVILIRNSGHLPDKGLVFPMIIDMYLTLFLVVFSSDMIALLISSIVKNENSAMMIMPFILVIQLVMSGVVFRLEGLASWISWLTISRWGVEGIMAIARTNLTVDLQAAMAPSSGGSGSGTLVLDWIRLIVFAMVYILLAMLMLRKVDKDQR